MHLRYDFKNKTDLSNFKTQSKFFLKKEDCVFSFYLEDFAISFDVNKVIDISPSPDGEAIIKNLYKIQFSIIDIVNKHSGVEVATINPLTDFRFKDISQISDLFDGSSFVTSKESIEESLTFVEFMLNCVKKVKKMSALA